MRHQRSDLAVQQVGSMALSHFWILLLLEKASFRPGVKAGPVTGLKCMWIWK